MPVLILTLIAVDILLVMCYIKLKNLPGMSDKEVLEKSYSKEDARK